jgi:hypothetical protein
LAELAQQITDNCSEVVPGEGQFTGGQLFNSSNYTIIITLENCHAHDDFNRRRILKKEELITAQLKDRELPGSYQIIHDANATRVTPRAVSATLCFGVTI